MSAEKSAATLVLVVRTLVSRSAVDVVEVVVDDVVAAGVAPS